MKKYQRSIAVFLAMLIAISGINTNLGFALDPIDYRDVRFGEDLLKPIAKFGVSVNNSSGPYTYSIEEDSINYDNHPKITAYVGDTLYIKDMSYSREGWAITGNSYDFQYYGLGYTYKAYTTKSNVEKPIALNQAGTLTIYLMVKDKDNIVQGWHNWSQNGTRRVLGDHMAITEQKVWWYFTAITVEVKVPEPTAEFEIHYQGTNVTDNINNPIQLDSFPYNVNLIDKSTTPAGTHITGWEWQGNAGSGWVPLSTQQNPSDSVAGGWKGFRLRTTNNKGGVSAWKQHDVYAKLKGGAAPEPPPESNTAEINPSLLIDPIPRVVPIKYKDYHNDVSKQVRLELDASKSTATEGIQDYLFYFRIGENDWVDFDWTSNSKMNVNITVRKSDEDSNGKIPIVARVGVRDKKGEVKYASATDSVIFDVQIEPPETKLSLPPIFYPREITSTHPTIKNTIKWNYTGDMPYAKSIVSLYKYNDTDEAFEPIFENREMTERELVVEGNPDEVQKIEVSVVDSIGLVSPKVDAQYIYENAYPKIKVTVNNSREATDGELDIQVVKLTGPEIEAIYPTTYTTWVITDAFGSTIASGTGKLPEKIAIDDRFKANSLVFKQYAKNILEYTTSDKDFYKNNSKLDFLLAPTRLFETERAQVTDISESILNKKWLIKKISDPEYTELILDEQKKFTRDAGIYIVKLEGDARFVLDQNMYQYANDKEALKQIEPVELTNAEILAKHGIGFIYVQNSAKWMTGESIEKGKYNVDGKVYSFRRRLNYLVINEFRNSKERQVEFISGTPAADFVKIGEDRVFKRLTVDGSNSVNVTNQELQQYYPILFNHERTKFVIEPIKGPGGAVDASLLSHIKGESKTLTTNSVEFRGKQIQDFRVDRSMFIRISYTVFNGLKNSPYVQKEFYIEPDLEPTVDINVSQSVVYRDANNQLKTRLGVIVTYSSPDDEIDLDKSKLSIYYDKNNDGQSNDGEQWIMKGSNSLESYLTIEKGIFGENQAEFILVADNVDKNILGRFKFEFEAIEKPKTPNFEIPGEVIPILKADTKAIEDQKKVIYIDNQQPVITLDTRRRNKNEIWIIETHDQPINYNALLEQLGLNKLDATVIIIKKDKSIQTIKN